jgi:hypothetical protein
MELLPTMGSFMTEKKKAVILKIGLHSNALDRQLKPSC